MANTYEQKFLNALRDIFVGAKIEGESGYINLMRIKSRYYTEGVFPRLMEKIETEIKDFPAFREELFDKLYTFFKRYFSESGSIYFRHTPYYQDIYERIYTDDRDVMLFWKTQNLYYVKTDRLFRSLTVSLDDAPEQKYSFDATAVAKQIFDFDASTLQNKRNNEKRSLVFSYEGLAENETLKFAVNYSQGATKTKTDDILKAIKRDGVKINEDQLTRAFSLFERQSEVDFFINKNAKAFLNEQFDLWMYQYLFKNDATEWKEARLRQMQALKRTAYAIIEFVAQFEDELVRIWNKPKFALAANYVITFDRVFEKSAETAEKLLAHEGIAAQIEEWQTLGIIGNEAGEQVKDQSKQDSLFAGDASESEIAFNKLVSEFLENSSFIIQPSSFRFLPFDTKHFKSLETEILSLFDNLDEELDGRLIHSENYQALNTLKEKFREKVKTIYIDPPYNTNENDFDYKDGFKSASWLSMMTDRLLIAQDLMKDSGIFFVSIDDYEGHRLRLLMAQVLGETSFITSFVRKRRAASAMSGNLISADHEYIHTFAKPKFSEFRGLEKDYTAYKNPDNDPRGDWTLGDLTVGMDKKLRPNQFYPLENPRTKKEFPANPNRVWAYIPESMEKEIDSGRILFPDDPLSKKLKLKLTSPMVKRYRNELKSDVNPVSTWIETGKRKVKLLSEENAEFSISAGLNTESTKEILNLFNESIFTYAKPTSLAESLISQSVLEKEISCDFFGGSGTTAHAVINLNREDGGRRKYILVEANDYFHTVILPRVKKVVFSDKWKNGKADANGTGVSHFCKYFALEQYEDTLRRAAYVNDRESDAPSFFDNPYESAFSSYVFLRDKKMSDALDIDYEADKITVDFAKLYAKIDWAETLSCVKGKFIKSVTAESVTFTDGETIKFAEIDYRDILPLIWWDK